jgi:hypothetical protein
LWPPSDPKPFPAFFFFFWNPILYTARVPETQKWSPEGSTVYACNSRPRLRGCGAGKAMLSVCGGERRWWACEVFSGLISHLLSRQRCCAVRRCRVVRPVSRALNLRQLPVPKPGDVKFWGHALSSLTNRYPHSAMAKPGITTVPYTFHLFHLFSESQQRTGSSFKVQM